MEVVFQVLQIASNYLAAWVKNKKTIIFFKTMSSVMSALMFFSVGKFVAAIPTLFTIVRSTLFLYRDKYKTNLVLWLCVGGYLILAFFSVDSVGDLLPTVVSVLASIIIWFCNPIGIKIGLSVTDNIWMVYYLMTGLYLSALNIILQTIVALISAVRIHITQSKNDMNDVSN